MRLAAANKIFRTIIAKHQDTSTPPLLILFEGKKKIKKIIKKHKAKYGNDSINKMLIIKLTKHKPETEAEPDIGTDNDEPQPLTLSTPDKPLQLE